MPTKSSPHSALRTSESKQGQSKREEQTQFQQARNKTHLDGRRVQMKEFSTNWFVEKTHVKSFVPKLHRDFKYPYLVGYVQNRTIKLLTNLRIYESTFAHPQSFGEANATLLGVERKGDEE